MAEQQTSILDDGNVERLAHAIDEVADSTTAVRTVLRTDDRVFARITDGIYRQPSSAIRELISNAYDADATEVTVDTDAPRFERVRISDNGNGMSAEALANLIYKIGGSFKRTIDGAEAGVTNPDNPSFSPKGRKLIGKIGIGLFSVAQLTQHFEIITKVKGENRRLVASVKLKTYTEDELASRPMKDRVFETGDVVITAVPAADIDAQGTDIVLLDLREQAKNILRSQERWEPPDQGDTEELSKWHPPLYHIGTLSADETAYERAPNLPWNPEEAPDVKFRAMVDAVISEARRNKTPEVAKLFDNYLAMLWGLGLSAPLQYVEDNPFKLTGADGVEFLGIQNERRGKAILRDLGSDQSVESHFGVSNEGSALPFRVLIDGVELLRPIVFRNMATDRDRIRTPMLFVGSFSDDLARFDSRYSGGPLSFDAYLYWTNKVVPRENNGVLIRINNASGTLFDAEFLKYQVAELTRLKQIEAEIFVHRGLDAALNIDRESFNFAHPHYQIVARWLHVALRQVTNRLKLIEKEIREERRLNEGAQLRDAIRSYADAVWANRRGDELGGAPDIIIRGPGESADEAQDQAAIVFENFIIDGLDPSNSRALLSTSFARERLNAIVVLLDAYELLDMLTLDEQRALISQIARVVES